MLTEQELKRIFSWNPYRENWPIDRNLKDDNIEGHYGPLIKSLTQNSAFDAYYSEDGQMGNYLEFICYPVSGENYNGNAIVVCISICAPVVAYGQITVQKGKGIFAWGGLFMPEDIYIIKDPSLADIEKEIKSILTENRLSFLEKEFVSRMLPMEVAEELKYENHNDGNQYLHGIFQKND